MTDEELETRLSSWPKPDQVFLDPENIIYYTDRAAGDGLEYVSLEKAKRLYFLGIMLGYDHAAKGGNVLGLIVNPDKLFEDAKGGDDFLYQWRSPYE